MRTTGSSGKGVVKPAGFSTADFELQFSTGRRRQAKKLHLADI